MRFPLSSSAFASTLIDVLLVLLEFVRTKALAPIIMTIAISAIITFLFIKVITRMLYLKIFIF